MKKLFFILLFAVATTLSAQTFKSVKVNVKLSQVTIDNFVIKKGTLITDAIKVLGKPERTEQTNGKDRIYAYDSKGIAISVFPGTTKIESFTITYTPDGDKNTASGKYAGTLMIDTYNVTPKSTTKEISDKSDFDELTCFGPMCMSDLKTKSFGVILSVLEDKTIGQIAFGFKP